MFFLIELVTWTWSAAPDLSYGFHTTCKLIVICVFLSVLSQFDYLHLLGVVCFGTFCLHVQNMTPNNTHRSL